MTQADRIHIFTEELWHWYSTNKRNLPWRDLKISDPNQKAYLIWISEVMLQQTQVSRVIILYKQFIQKFPLVEDLANATNAEILIAWRGMGYNSRALRLRDGAKAIVTNFKGEFPSSMEELQSIKGIGHYTAAAIRNFAFGIPTPCMDVNIRRILHRFFVGMENGDGSWEKNDKYLLEVSKRVLEVALVPPPPAPPPSARSVTGEGRLARTTADWHAALMDFGSLVCTKNNPKWELLSPELRSVCRSYGKHIVRTKKVNSKQEPGREMAGRFIPNRIFRGRIVEQLRDHPKGLSPEEIGRRIAVDWLVLSETNGTMGDHKKWLAGLIEGLKRDGMIEQRGATYRLQSN